MGDVFIECGGVHGVLALVRPSDSGCKSLAFFMGGLGEGDAVLRTVCLDLPADRALLEREVAASIFWANSSHSAGLSFEYGRGISRGICGDVATVAQLTRRDPDCHVVSPRD